MSAAAELTPGQLADLIGGNCEGNPQLVITGVAGLTDAQSEHVSFLANARYASLARTSLAGAMIVGIEETRPNPHVTLIRVSNPSAAFATVCAHFLPPPAEFPPGISPGAHIHPSATVAATASIQPGAVIEAGAVIGERAIIGANVYVGHGATIGDGTHLHPNVVVRERCVIGAHCLINAGAVIGSEGFGFDITSPTNSKIPQIGIVRIGDHVEIGANTCIDRARFGQTLIGNGVKIDNLVQIAHNVVIGDNSVVVALTGIAGSTTLGKRVILAGQVGLAGHTHVGDGAILTAKSGVSKDVPAGVVVSGIHALPMKEELRVQAALRGLPELIKRVRRLEKQLQAQGKTEKTD